MDGSTNEAPRGEPLLRSLTRALYLAFGLVVLLWFLFRVRRVLLLLAMAVVAALVLNAPVQRLERRGWPRGAAVLATVAAVLAGLGGLGWLVVPRLAHEVPALLERLPDLAHTIVAQVAALFGNAPDVVRQLSRLMDWALGRLGTLWHYADRLLETLLLGIVVTAMTVFLLSRPRPLLRAYLLAMPPRHRDAAERAFARGSRMVVGWVAANLVLGAIKAVITYAFLAWMGIDGALLWAVLAVFTSLVPIIGFYVLAVPPVVLALARSPLDALWTLLFFWGMSEILGDFVAPHLWSRTMRLQPVYLLFMVLAMTVTFGAAGVLVAIPVAGFLQAFLDEFYLSRQPPDDRLEERVDRMLAREVEG